MQASNKSTESGNSNASSIARPSRPSAYPLLSIGQAAKQLGISVSCLRIWTNQGQFPCIRSKGLHRYIRREDVLSYMGLDESNSINNENATIPVCLCGRVSSRKQSGDLERQVESLREYVSSHYPNAIVTEYIAVRSGLNFSDKTFVKMISDILAGKFRGGVVVVTYRERIVRFGKEFLDIICQQGGCSIVETKQEEERDFAQDLTESILALTHVASCRLYARRSAETNSKHVSNDCVIRMVELRRSNMAITEIVDTLNKEGFRMGKGKNEEKWTEEISGWCVEKYLDQNGVSKLCDLAVDLHKVEDSQLENQAPIDRFIEERIVKTGERKDKILLAEFGKAYGEWCANNGLVVECRETIGILLNTRNLGRCRVNGRRMLWGVKLA